MEKKHTHHEEGSPSHVPEKKLSGPLILIEESWNYYVANWKPLLALVLCSALVFVGLIIAAFIIGLILAVLPVAFAFKVVIAVILGIAAFCGLIYINTLIYGAQILFLKDESNLKYIERIKQARPYFLGVVLTGILMAGAGLGGMILFIIPGIFLGVVLQFAVFAYFTENKKGFDALLASYTYTKGYFWAVLWRGIVVGVLIMAVSLLVTLISDRANILVSLLAGPFTLIYHWKIFNELKAIKHGTTQVVKGLGIKIISIFGIVIMVLLAFALPFIITKGIQESDKIKNDPTFDPPFHEEFGPMDDGMYPNFDQEYDY